MKTKKIDLGEYIVVIQYEKETGHLLVSVLDEIGGLIESIDTSIDEDEDAPSVDIDSIKIVVNNNN